MQHSTRLFAILPVALTLAVAATPAAGAGGFGNDVAACARHHLGQRDGAPAVTCIHAGVPPFPTFGAMVLHMKGHHR